MALSESRKRANAKYNAKAYETILFRVKAGQKAEIQAHAEKFGESMNGFLTRAVDETIGRDNDGEPENAQKTGS